MDILRADVADSHDDSRVAYREIIDLLRAGRLQEARLKAVAIPSPHTRDMALVLIERSKPIAA